MAPEHWARQIGRDLEKARRSHRPRLSIRAAAARAELSEATWRNLERGEQPTKGGGWVPMNPRPDTIIKAAGVVGLDPAPMLLAGGYDADEEILEAMSLAEEPTPGTPAELLIEIVRELRELRGQIESVLDRLPPRQSES